MCVSRDSGGGLETVVTAVAVETGIVGELFRVTSQVHLLIRLVERAKRRVQFTIVFDFEDR